VVDLCIAIFRERRGRGDPGEDRTPERGFDACNDASCDCHGGVARHHKPVAWEAERRIRFRARIALAGVAGAASWLFYFLALKIGQVNSVVVIDRLSVVFVVILSAIFLGEALTWKTALGVALMVGGALLVAFA
jgi:drug/metabolite transporter (DMT)-like permease